MKYILAGIITFLLSAISLHAQSGDGNIDGSSTNALNPIRATVPFMNIAADSRAAGMGDVGASTSPDLNSQYWNASKYAFMEDKMGFSIAYTPWLRSLNVNDIHLLYLAGYYKLDDLQSVSGSIKYFDLGVITATDDRGFRIGQITPNEFSIDAAYARKLGENFGAALTFKIIYSDIGGGLGSLSVTEGQYKKGFSFGSDLSTYYQKDLNLFGYQEQYALGITISNIGSKMTYNEGGEKQYIPTNLRIGNRLSVDVDDYNSVAMAIEFNKLLVPTPDDSTDFQAVNNIEGMGRSFYDAPNGFTEEMQEVMWSLGFEYWYREQFAVRTGYFHEHENKGNRKYFTVGIGLKFNIFTFDYSYLVPAQGGRANPLANTMRFTLGFQFAE